MSKKKTGIIGIVVTVILLIILVFVSNLKLSKFSYVENAFSKLVMPIQSGITYLKEKLTGNDNYFATMDYLKQENELLKQKNAELEEALRSLEIIQAENTTLKEYLNLTAE